MRTITSTFSCLEVFALACVVYASAEDAPSTKLCVRTVCQTDDQCDRNCGTDCSDGQCECFYDEPRTPKASSELKNGTCQRTISKSEPPGNDVSITPVYMYLFPAANPNPPKPAKPVSRSTGFPTVVTTQVYRPSTVMPSVTSTRPSEVTDVDRTSTYMPSVSRTRHAAVTSAPPTFITSVTHTSSSVVTEAPPTVMPSVSRTRHAAVTSAPAPVKPSSANHARSQNGAAASNRHVGPAKPKSGKN